MKKIVLMIMACLCTIVAMYAQNKANITDEHLSNKGLITEFMGIPVDGYKQDMIKKLESKGFVYNEDLDRLEGEFNGEDVYISIVTNNNKVWRIAIFEKIRRNEQQIKVRFNRLCEQFENNKKYIFLGESQVIPKETNISYEMSIKNRSFEASYFQEIDINKIDTISFKNHFLEITDEANESLKEKLNEKQVDEIKEIIKSDFGLFVTILKTKKHVWFTIFKNYGMYYITLFYDNEYNKANGEDL